MNAHDTNALTRTILSIARSGAKAEPVARAQCSAHRRDDLGWPLGNCVECADFRKKMDDWHFEQVLSGNHDPDRFDTAKENNRDTKIDRNTAHLEGWGWQD